jgi:site-specific recombinase XerD
VHRYILFHGTRHPAEMGAAGVMGFLSSLAVAGRVAASTQNQALSAILFVYRDVLELDLPWLDGVVRAKRPDRLPVVLTREEVAAVLRPLHRDDTTTQIYTHVPNRGPAAVKNPVDAIFGA